MRNILLYVFLLNTAWGVSIHGTGDVRGVWTDSLDSFYEQGGGKFRYGGDKGKNRALVRVSNASLLLSESFSDRLHFTLQVNADAEPELHDLEKEVDLIQAFFQYHIQADSSEWRMKAGVLFPPLSMEHGVHPWTPLWTISPSTMNSWVGEEVRSLSIEAGGSVYFGEYELRVGFGIFGWNDPAGSLLAYRGFTINDRLTGFSEGIPLPVSRALTQTGAIPMQAHWVKPFKEIDGRPGYYTLFGFKHDSGSQVRYMYYDNQADETQFNGTQYAWDTAFHMLGGQLNVGSHFELLSQIMYGSTLMGEQANGKAVVKNEFFSAYVMPSIVWGDNRLALRAEHFFVSDEDTLIAENPNDEDGHAYTLSYQHAFNQYIHVQAEYTFISSERDDRIDFGLSHTIDENMTQMMIRITY